MIDVSDTEGLNAVHTRKARHDHRLINFSQTFHLIENLILLEFHNFVHFLSIYWELSETHIKWLWSEAFAYFKVSFVTILKHLCVPWIPNSVVLECLRTRILSWRVSQVWQLWHSIAYEAVNWFEFVESKAFFNRPLLQSTTEIIEIVSITGKPFHSRA